MTPQEFAPAGSARFRIRSGTETAVRQKRGIRHGAAGAGIDAVKRHAERREDPGTAMARVSDEQATPAVYHQSVRLGQAARQLGEDLGLAGLAAGGERDAPDLGGRRQRQEGMGSLPRDGDAVRARGIADDPVEAPVRPEPVERARRVVHAGLALVGEQDRAVGQELQVLQPLEALAVDRAEDGLDRAVLRIMAS